MDNNKEEETKLPVDEERPLEPLAVMDGSARSSCPVEIESFEAKLARKLKKSDTVDSSSSGEDTQAQDSQAAASAASVAATAAANGVQTSQPPQNVMDFEARIEAKLTETPVTQDNPSAALDATHTSTNGEVVEIPTNANEESAKASPTATGADMCPGATQWQAWLPWVTAEDVAKNAKAKGANVLSLETLAVGSLAAPASDSTGQQQQSSSTLPDNSIQNRVPAPTRASIPGAFAIAGIDGGQMTPQTSTSTVSGMDGSSRTQDGTSYNMPITAADTGDSNDRTQAAFEEEPNANSSPFDATLYESVEFSLQRQRTTDLEMGSATVVSPFSSFPEGLVSDKTFQGTFHEEDEESHYSLHQSNKLKMIISLVAVIALAAIVAAAEALLGSPSSSSMSASNETDTLNSTNDTVTVIDSNECNGMIYPPAIGGLHDITLANINDTCSVAYKANVWMSNDPNLQNYSILRQFQRFGLAAIYFSTNGLNWTHNDHWLDYNTSECDWFFSEEPDKRCNSDDLIVSFGLRNNNLEGELPIELGYLTTVIHLDFSDNKLRGMPPLVIGDKSAVQSMNVSHNMLEAHFVAEDAGSVNAIYSVRVMDLSHNRFTGDASISLYMYPNIEIILANDNYFSGSMDRPGNQVMQSLETLRIYRAENNRITGTIPSEFGAMKALEILDVSGNFLSGTIPEELGNASSLTYFNAQGNEDLEGTVPEGLCLLEQNDLLTLQVDCDLLECCAGP